MAKRIIVYDKARSLLHYFRSTELGVREQKETIFEGSKVKREKKSKLTKELFRATKKWREKKTLKTKTRANKKKKKIVRNDERWWGLEKFKHIFNCIYKTIHQ